MAPSLCSAVTKLNTTNDISRVLNCKQHPGHTTFFCFNVIFPPSSQSKMYISSALSYACTSWKVGPRGGGVAYIYIYICLRIFLHAPGNTPQTLNQHFMKEFFPFRALGMPGVCENMGHGCLGFVRLSQHAEKTDMTWTMKSWLVNRDPYFMAYDNRYTTG